MKLEIFEALTAANVPADKAREVAHSIDRAIDRRYAIHEKQLVTRGYLAEAETRLIKAIAEIQKSMAEMQRWTLAAVFGGMAAVAAIIKLIP
jgi:predicted Rossmann-fold nucleotide-binding protein